MAISLGSSHLRSGVGWEAGEGSGAQLLQELVGVREETVWCPEGKIGVPDKSLNRDFSKGVK